MSDVQRLFDIMIIVNVVVILLALLFVWLFLPPAYWTWTPLEALR